MFSRLQINTNNMWEVPINCAPMNIGNHLLAYFHACYLSGLMTRDSRIFVNSIPELGLNSLNQSISADKFKNNISSPKSLYLRSRNRKGWPLLMALISDLINVRIQINEPMMSLKRLPSVRFSRIQVPGHTYFKKKAYTLVHRYIDSHLFVNIRAGDILKPIHRDYRPLSSNEIRYACHHSGQPLLFYGQTQHSSYMETIRNQFPEAIFLCTNCPYTDFEINRIAKKILIPISTFSWVSTWISDSAVKIYFPKHGLYSKKDRPDVELIDIADSRYEPIYA